MARGARQAGFVGVFFDNEEYGGTWLDFPEDYANPARSREEYVDQARRRGREVMAAMVAAFPAIRVLTLHGPYVSEPKTPARVTRNQVGDADAYDLLGPFFVGFVEGMGPQSMVIDGGEVYQYRSKRDFAGSYAWRKRGIATAETDCAFIPPEVRARWGASVGVGFGVYNRSWPDKRRDRMTPEIMEKTLAHALRRADDLVWYYTERDTWLERGGMPESWFRAVRRARRASGLD